MGSLPFVTAKRVSFQASDCVDLFAILGCAPERERVPRIFLDERLKIGNPFWDLIGTQRGS